MNTKCKCWKITKQTLQVYEQYRCPECTAKVLKKLDKFNK